MAKGLVLAGGGARGSYQVGAYQALLELGWAPGVIVGTSVGCLNGALFVQDAWEQARDMWLAIDNSQVMAAPAPEDAARLHQGSSPSFAGGPPHLRQGSSPSFAGGPPRLQLGTAGTREKAAFLADLVRQGGLDVSPLERIVRLCLNEAAVRRAPVRYGLVTVQQRTLRAEQLAIEEIPDGMLADYMLASAACFPAFQPRQIEGTAFIDGGYADNMPTGLAARLGADELLCIDLDGVGIVRPNTTGLPTRILSSHWDLGPILTFSPKVAARNIELGYLDAYRLFGRVLGIAYAIRPAEGEKLAARFLPPYGACMARAIRANPALALTEKLALDLFAPGRGEETVFAPLELACEAVGADPARLWQADELCEAFLAGYEPERAARFAPLFEPEPRTRLLECGIAAAEPAEFVAAAVYTALCGGQPAQRAAP